jgi:hypothetical protein
MDGHVLQEAFTAEFRQANPLRVEQASAQIPHQAQAPVMTAEEEQAMLQRLQDLGYLD